MIMILIALCEGKRVRDPKTNWQLEVGKPYRVEQNQFWLKRMADKDVKLYVEKDAPPAEVAKSAPAKPAAKAKQGKKK